MKNVVIDDNGDARCWNCGAKSFREKRTFRAKLIVVLIAITVVGLIFLPAVLATKKKLRCNNCGKYNDVA